LGEGVDDHDAGSGQLWPQATRAAAQAKLDMMRHLVGTPGPTNLGMPVIHRPRDLK